MPHRGYIKLFRRFDTWPYRKKPAYVSVWIYLLTHASHGKVKMVFNGKKITLKPGQLIAGSQVISMKTGVPRASVSRVLKCFENGTAVEPQIETVSSPRGSLITVLNWDKWQGPEAVSETVSEPVSEQQVRHNKNEKNVKQELRTKSTTTKSTDVAGSDKEELEAVGPTPELATFDGPILAEDEKGVMVPAHQITKLIGKVTSSSAFTKGKKFPDLDYTSADDAVEKMKTSDDLAKRVYKKYPSFNPFAFAERKLKRGNWPIECFIDLFERLLAADYNEDTDSVWAIAEYIWGVEAQNVVSRIEAQRSQATEDPETRKRKGTNT